jgi:hypothetical protein
MNKKTPEILMGASRQYKHNNEEPGFVHGFDYESTIEIVTTLQNIINMCFEDSCSLTGQIKKKTALELVKHQTVI